MLKNLYLLPLAGLLAFPACVVVSDDSDSDSANDASSGADTSTSTSTSSTSTTSGTTESGSSGDTGSDSGSDSDSGDTTEGVDSSGTSSGAGCGWGPIDQKAVEEGYVCGGPDAEDPEGTFPRDCPRDTDLVEGGECGSVMGPGCCDGDDVWFCADDGSGPVLFTEACG